MRCKVGDMVELIHSEFKQNIGACGEVVGIGEFFGDWLIKWAGPISGIPSRSKNVSLYPPGSLGFAFDSHLRPIRPDTDPESIDTPKELEAV